MSTLVKYNPWSFLKEVQDEIGQFFDRNQLLGDGFNVPLSQWTPKVDIREESNQFVLSADLPGMEPKDIHVSIEADTLSIKGERQLERKVEKDNYSKMERFTGSFERRFTLPAHVDAEHVQANMKHGVLELLIPKKAGPSPKMIEVKIQGQ